MNMTNLLSERLAANARKSARRADSRLSLPLRGSAGRETATALGAWETEGGAASDSAQADEHPTTSDASVDRVLLERLGEALVNEWSHVPRSLQRAIYERAVSDVPSMNRLTIKRQMARFLHDRKGPRMDLTD